MNEDREEYALEFLLAFDGRRHFYPGGYFVKFEIRRVAPTTTRPHGLRYSFTLHDSDGQRLIGFDNAHTIAPAGGRFARPAVEADHWHRSSGDPGRPYAFVSAERLIDDFFDAVEQELTERGVELTVVATEGGKRS